MATKIYTKTGDKGSTALIGGTKVPKSHLRIESYGIVDELNSFIGLLGDHLTLANPVPDSTNSTPTAAPDPAPGSAISASAPPGSSDPAHGSAEFPAIHTFLLEVQDRLFTIGSSLACDPEKEPKLKIPDLKEADVLALETHIDKMESSLPPMKSFLLPGGHVAVSTAHIVRCICRRAERACVRLQEAQLFVDPLVLRYLNRLSDYFFVLARYIGHLLHAPEIPWKPRI